MTSTVAEASDETSLDSVSRLLVTVRDASSGRYRPVGFLTHDRVGFEFAYLRREVGREDFRPLPGLARARAHSVRSGSLFPLFAERVISSRRPDRWTSLDALGLPSDAAPFEVLARSHGQRVGDTIELLPAPNVSPGSPLSLTFLAHGVRHLPEANQARLESLTVGQALLLRAETDNPVNPRAQLVTDLNDVALGWMPDPLLEIVERIENRQLTVERVNGPEVGFHLRLLVRLQGRVPPGVELFTGADWETV